MSGNAKKTLQSKPRPLVHVATIFLILASYQGRHCLHSISLVNIDSNLLHPSDTLMSIEKFYVITGNRIYSDVNLVCLVSQIMG